MRFAVSALRANAEAVGAGPQGSTHASGSLSSLPSSPASLALASAASHSSSPSCLHFVFLLSRAAAAAVAWVVATWHGAVPALQPARQPGVNDLAQVSRHERKDSDAVSRNQRLHGARDCATDERCHSRLDQAHRAVGGRIIGKRLPDFGEDAARLGLDDMDLVGDVENRCDPVVPSRERRFHRCAPPVTFLTVTKAIAVPTRSGFMYCI